MNDPLPIFLPIIVTAMCVGGVLWLQRTDSLPPVISEDSGDDGLEYLFAWALAIIFSAAAWIGWWGSRL